MQECSWNVSWKREAQTSSQTWLEILEGKKTLSRWGSTSLTPCALSWAIIARAEASVASRTATTGSEKQTNSTGNIWITYLQAPTFFCIRFV